MTPDQHVEVPVPWEAVQKVAARACNRAASWGHNESWDGALHPETRRSYLQSAREDLRAAAPFIAAKAVREERERCQERFERIHGYVEASRHKGEIVADRNELVQRMEYIDRLATLDQKGDGDG